MSSFLSASENVARQRQNVRRDLKNKDGGRKQSGSAGVGFIIWFIFGLCCTGKMFQLQ